MKFSSIARLVMLSMLGNLFGVKPSSAGASASASVTLPLPQSRRKLRTLNGVSCFFDGSLLTTEAVRTALVLKMEVDPSRVWAHVDPTDPHLLWVSRAGGSGFKDLEACDISSVGSVTNNTDREGVAEKLKRMDAFIELKPFAGYTVAIINPGQSVVLAWSSLLQVLTLTDKSTGGSGDYFDTEILGFGRSASSLCGIWFNTRSNPFVGTHSGDKPMGSLLAHWVTLPSMSNFVNPLVVAFVGYNQKPLVKLASHNPFVVFFDHERKVMYLYVPPVTEAECGAMTIVAPAVITKVSATHVAVTMPATPTLPTDPSGGSRVNTGISDADGRVLQELVRKATADAALVDRQHHLQQQSPQGASQAPQGPSQAPQDDDDLSFASVKKSSGGGKKAKTSLPAPTTTAIASYTGPALAFVVQRGLAFDNPPLGVHTIFFGQNRSFSNSSDNSNSSEVLLPLVVPREIEGALSIQGRPDDLADLPCSYSDLVHNCGLLVAYVSSYGWSDQVTTASRSRVSVGVFVVQPPAAASASLDVANRDALRVFLSELNMNAVIAQAGPNAIVVVLVNSQLFWYRGVSRPGLVDHVPAFGDNVSHLFSLDRLVDYAETTALRRKSPSFLAWDPVVPAGENRVWVPSSLFSSASSSSAGSAGSAGRYMSVPDVLALLKGLTLATLFANLTGLTDILTQLSVILPTQEFDALIPTIVNQCEVMRSALCESAVKAFKDAITEAVKNQAPINSPEVLEVRNQLKAVQRDSNDMFRGIASILETMCSSKSATRKFGMSMAMQAKKNHNASQYEKSKNMSVDAFLELITKNCEEVGVLCVTVDPALVLEQLARVAASRFLDDADNNNFDRMLAFESLKDLLDGITFGSIKDVTDNTPHQLAAASSTSSTSSTVLFLPSYSRNDGRTSMVGLPVLDEFARLERPELINWIKKADEDRCAAIRQKGFFQALKAVPALAHLNLPEGSVDTAWFVARIYLTVMLQLAQGSSPYHPPSSGNGSGDDGEDLSEDLAEDRDSTVRQTLRGLMGFYLSVLASRPKTLSAGYQLILPHHFAEMPLPASRGEWLYWAGLASVMPYTGWPVSVLHANIRTIVLKVVKNLFVDPLFVPLRQQPAEALKTKSGTSLEVIRARDAVFRLVGATLWQQQQLPTQAQALYLLDQCPECALELGTRHANTKGVESKNGSGRTRLSSIARLQRAFQKLKNGLTLTPGELADVLRVSSDILKKPVDPIALATARPILAHLASLSSSFSASSEDHPSSSSAELASAPPRSEMVQNLLTVLSESSKVFKLCVAIEEGSRSMLAELALMKDTKVDPVQFQRLFACLPGFDDDTQKMDETLRKVFVLFVTQWRKDSSTLFGDAQTLF